MPSYYLKTCGNEFNWKNLAAKTVCCTHSANRRISKEHNKIIFLIEHIQVFIYLNEKSSHCLQIKHSVWLFTILIDNILTNSFGLVETLTKFHYFFSLRKQNENSLLFYTYFQGTEDGQGFQIQYVTLDT